MAEARVKNLILNALRQVGKQSVTEETWFTRADIARQLGQSKLNPARVNALKALVDEEKVQVRQKPEDGRDLPQYQPV